MIKFHYLGIPKTVMLSDFPVKTSVSRRSFNQHIQGTCIFTVDWTTLLVSYVATTVRRRSLDMPSLLRNVIETMKRHPGSLICWIGVKVFLLHRNSPKSNKEVVFGQHQIAIRRSKVWLLSNGDSLDFLEGLLSKNLSWSRVGNQTAKYKESSQTLQSIDKTTHYH